MCTLFVPKRTYICMVSECLAPPRSKIIVSIISSKYAFKSPYNYTSFQFFMENKLAIESPWLQRYFYLFINFFIYIFNYLFVDKQAIVKQELLFKVLKFIFIITKDCNYISANEYKARPSLRGLWRRDGSSHPVAESNSWTWSLTVILMYLEML